MIKRVGNTLSTAYLMLMFCLYPFYVENGYINIGEAKNHFFLNVTVAACLLLVMIYMVMSVVGYVSKRKEGKSVLFNWENVSGLDLCMLLYATQLFLSFVFSEYKEVALWGEEGWYMGLLPLLLLCGVYFLISRLWQENETVLYASVAASAGVFVLGICNRISIYPMDFAGSQPGFISTLGNINWFCGFLAVVAPIGIGWFVIRERKSLWKEMLVGGYALLTFLIGFAQGSDSIFLWFGAVFFLLLWISIESKIYLMRWFVLLILWGIAPQIVRILRLLFADKYNYGTEGFCGYFTGNSISLWIILIGIVGYLVVGRSLVLNTDRMRKLLSVSAVLVLILLLVITIVNTKIGLPYISEIGLFTWDSNWGNGRGEAFSAGFKTFLEAPARQKLFGAGPDAFASAAYGVPEIAIALRQCFGTARLTNAHNELITTLVNTGILGALLYVCIFVAGMMKFLNRGREKKVLYLFALCIFGYFIHNMVSFAQVLNMPYLFMILGMGEGICRNQKTHKIS